MLLLLPIRTAAAKCGASDIFIRPTVDAFRLPLTHDDKRASWTNFYTDKKTQLGSPFHGDFSCFWNVEPTRAGTTIKFV